MKEIQLTQGKVALVDDEDFEYLNQFKWHAHKSRSTYYAKGYDKNTNKKIIMHRHILGLTNSKIFGDHKDGDGLNNQRTNIRIATPSQNQKNKKPSGISKYIGVSFHTSKSKYFSKKENIIKEYSNTGWMASITINGKFTYLGKFDSEIEAAKEYNKAAEKHHGEFARLNII